MNGTVAVKRIIEEEGCSNVRDIFFDIKLDKWVVEYKNGLDENHFDSLYEVIVFFKTESQNQ